MPPTLPTPLGELVVRAFKIPTSAINPDPDVHRKVGLAFEWGDGINAPIINQFWIRPIPFGGSFTKWWAERNNSGDATFSVQYASSVTGSFASVGGTAPFITGAQGNSDTDGLDWTTLNFVEGGVLKVTLLTFTAATKVSLTIGADRTS